MATEKQIAANRENALKSSGPRSRSGKRRASANAYRHGLSAATTSERGSETLESLARSIAGNTNDAGIQDYARIAARAHLNLARVRQVELEIIERVYRFGALKPARRFRSIEAELAYLQRQPASQTLQWPEPVDPLGVMPSDKEARMAEAVRRLLPELEKLHRYERRSITMRNRALRAMIQRMFKNNHARDRGETAVLQNEPNI